MHRQSPLLVAALTLAACSATPAANDASTPDAPDVVAAPDVVDVTDVVDVPDIVDVPRLDVVDVLAPDVVDVPRVDVVDVPRVDVVVDVPSDRADVPTLPPVATVTFADDVSYRAGDGTNWVGVGDFNADRHPDVVAVNTDTSSVSLLQGNGDGTLRAAQTVPLMHSRINGALVHAAIGDVDGDGRADLAVSWRNVNEITVFRGAAFSTPLHINVTGPEGIAVADVNRDGRGDLVYVSRGGVEIARATAAGAFGPPTRTAVSIPYRVLPRDHDGDGAVDLTILGAEIVVWRNAGDGTFTERWRGPGAGGADGVAVADFTGDGALDLVTTHSGTNVKALVRGRADATFDPTITELLLGDDRHIATGDFNRDGRADLVLSACCNSINVALGRGDATFMSQSVHIGCGVVGGFAVGDLNEDGLADIVVAHGSCDSVSVILNRSR